MSLDQTHDGLSRREALSLGLAAVLSSLRPQSVEAREDDKRATKIYFYASRNAPANVEGKAGIFTVDPENDSWQFVIASFAARVSHNGKTLVYHERRARDTGKASLRLLDIETGETKFLSELFDDVAWSSDDRQLIVCGRKNDPDGHFETWRIDAADPSKKTRLPIAETDMVLDWSPDGKTLLVRKGNKTKGNPFADVFTWPTHLFDLAGKDLGRVLTPSPTRRLTSQRFTPDGKRIVFLCREGARQERGYRTVALDGKDERPLLKPRDELIYAGFPVWSPDRKRIAASMLKTSKEPSRIEITDPDGTNPRRLALPEDFEQLLVIDWR